MQQILEVVVVADYYEKYVESIIVLIAMITSRVAACVETG